MSRLPEYRLRAQCETVVGPRLGEPRRGEREISLGSLFKQRREIRRQLTGPLIQLGKAEHSEAAVESHAVIVGRKLVVHAVGQNLSAKRVGENPADFTRSSAESRNSGKSVAKV